MKYWFYFQYDDYDQPLMHQYKREHLRFPYYTAIDEDITIGGVEYMQHYSWLHTPGHDVLALHLMRH